MKKNRVLCLLLAVLMALSMAGCKGNFPGSETSHTGSSKKKPSKADIDSTSIRNPNTDRLDGSGGDGVNIEGDYDDSLDLLREMMGTEPSILFAAAFIGNSAGGPDDLAIPLSEWILAEDPGLCAQYTFIRQIPRERVVGSGGSLLCVVPRDPNATLAVNRIRYDPKSGEYENLEVLYRSETGEPILVYACADMGESPFPDTEITVTDSSGRTAVWRPLYGTSIRPDDYDTDAPMGYDFTNYSQEHGEDYDDDYGGDVDGDVSWMAPTAEQLCRNMWVWDGDLDRQYAIASIFFEPGGWVTFEWWYEEDNGAYQEVYEGDWSLQDDMLGLRMTRTGGERFREGERAVEITGVFPVQIPMGFEDFPTFNNEIIAHSVSAHRGDPKTYYNCLDQLCKRVKNVKEQTAGTVLHTDQGAVYSSRAFSRTHSNYNIIRSMSRAETPTDNPIIESLNGWMKAELILDFGISKVSNLKKTLDQYVLYFNSERFAAALDYKTPIQYRTELGF